MEASSIIMTVLYYTLVGLGFACGFEIFRRIKAKMNKGRNSQGNQKWL
jgi:hypothetical protein